MKTTNLKLNVNDLVPHPDNPRKDVGDVSELAKSIKANGVMQNLTVFPIEGETDKYMVLIGHRRLAAAKEAGVEKLPCSVIFEDVPDRAKQIEIMLEENMQRHDLTPFEEAESFQLCLDLGETVDGLCEKTGFSKSTIRHRVEMAKLDRDSVKSHSEGGESFQLSLMDYYELEKVPSLEARNDVLKKARTPEHLRQLIAYEVTEAKKAKAWDALLVKLTSMGINKVPKNLEGRYYDADVLEEAWSVDLVNASNKPELLDDISLKPKKEWHGKTYWAVRYSRAYIYYAVDKKKKKEIMPAPEPTAADLAKKEKESRKRKLSDIRKECYEQMRRCVMNVITGKVQRPKRLIEEDLTRQLFPMAVGIRTGVSYVSAKNMWETHDFGYGEDWWKTYSSGKQSDELKKDLEMIAALPVSYQLMLCLVAAFKSVEFWDWNIKFIDSENNRWVRDFIDILMQFGFMPTKEQRQLICGTNELYTKQEDKA